METYLLLSLLFMYHLIRSLHYSYLRNLFAQTLKASLSLSLSVCISFYQAPELTCDVEKFMGAPNAPASHAFIKDRLIPSRVVHSHDASNGLTWRIFHRDLCTSSSIACCNQQSTLRLHASLLYRTSCGLITIYPRPQDHPLGEFICGFIYSPPKKKKKTHTLMSFCSSCIIHRKCWILFCHHSHPGNFVSIDQHSRQTGCTRMICRDDDEYFSFCWIWRCCLQTLLGGGGGPTVHVCMWGRVWYQEYKSIR